VPRGAWTVVLVVMLCVITASLATASPGPSSTTQVINLISTATPINDFVDLGPAGFSPGDLYVFSDRLFPVGSPDEQVGTSDGRCVLIEPATFRFDCSATVKLPDGELIIAGTLTLVEGTTSTGAIVGGRARIGRREAREAPCSDRLRGRTT
jgi:hypothetical protein